MNSSRRRLLQLAAFSPAAGMLDAFARPAWPDKPIRFVVGYPSGQAVDLIARKFAAVMGKELGQSIFVDNRGGANGIIGALEVKQSRPDGYMVLFGATGQLTINPTLYRKLPYDTLKDFAPVGLIVTAPLFLVANPSFPANNLQELIAYARTRPGKIDYGSGGIGIGPHLAMELLQEEAGIKLNHIPYNGSPAALNDLIGGRISLAMDGGPSAMPQVKAGRLKVLGSSSLKRAAAFPAVPTIAEQGLTGFDVVAWDGMVASAGTPIAVISALNLAIRNACSDPQVIESMRAMGVETAPDTAAEFGSFLQSEIRKWGKAVVRAGIQVD